ncbi:MAG: DUF2442 domain-containing protein [Longimicrobiales bacterium]|nr:DUF2442 domain-containing protein [Longimicrobiales bacterium]
MAKVVLTDSEVRAQIPGARMRAIADDGPRARSVRYDAPSGRLMVELTDGCLLGFPAEVAQGLRGAAPEDLAQGEVALGGRALRWERLDADLLVAGLVRGLFGSRRWMRDLAREWGARGGRARSEAKATAARRNGRKGGRPRRS